MTKWTVLWKENVLVLIRERLHISEKSSCIISFKMYFRGTTKHKTSNTKFIIITRRVFFYPTLIKSGVSDKVLENKGDKREDLAKHSWKE